jgi:secreted trypsin-like serine protease
MPSHQIENCSIRCLGGLMKSNNALEALQLNKLAMVCLALGLAACAPAVQNSGTALSSFSGDAGIINGKTVAESDPVAHSTVGLVIETSRGTALCTGTLVSESVVMTAAHCLAGASRGAVVFSLDLEKADERDARGISDALVHPKVDLSADKNSNDIALVKFDGTLPRGYSPARLLASAKEIKTGMTVVLAGYGATGMNVSAAKAESFLKASKKPAKPRTPSRQPQPTGTPILRKVDVKLTNATYTQTEILFDMSADGGGACHGDSGGPALATINGQLTVIGVTSRSATEKGGATCKEGSIYTNVGAFGPFIKSSIDKLERAK